MAAKPDAQLFQLLSNLLHEAGVTEESDLSVEKIVESLTNQEEVEMRAKIEALGLEVTKVPTSSSKHLDELEIAKELDILSAKLDNVDEMISSAVASDPQVQSLLCSTADVWLPVITATSDERRKFTVPVAGDDKPETNGKNCQ